MIITSLVDDYCPLRGIRGEHGLSIFLETANTKVLFDTGQGTTFLENARLLGIDLSGLDAVVLSHGHYDHGGGLSALYDALGSTPPPLFVGRGFADHRGRVNGNGVLDLGLPSATLPPGSPPALVIETFEELAPHISFLPKVERLDGTDPNPRFRIIQAHAEGVDEFQDELSLVIDEDDGIVVVTGCAHRGIVNIARAAALAFPGRPIKGLVGGFHLVEESPDVIAGICRDIAAMAPARVLPCHCTGLDGFAALAEALPGKVSWFSCGMSITL